jgi:hypothetical protein
MFGEKGRKMRKWGPYYLLFAAVAGAVIVVAFCVDLRCRRGVESFWWLKNQKGYQ